MGTQTIGLIAHTKKPGVADMVRVVAAELAQKSISMLMESDTAALVGQKGDGSIAQIGEASTLLIVLGGDGTILRVAGQLGDRVKPIFGINVGSLGFLTCSSAAECREAIDHVARGEIRFSERTMLDVRLHKQNGEESSRIFGLNDAVLSRGELSRLIRLRTRVDNEELTEFNADGLIVSTPTGSTAYSLSAGGPILAPQSGVFVITPICPHVLTNRSIIVAETSTIVVEATERDYPVYLTVDGRDPLSVAAGAEVHITRAAQRLPLAMMPGVSFFSVVRQKLKWSGSTV